jgi:hypothetical protein
VRYTHRRGGLLVVVGLLIFAGAGRHVWIVYHVLRALMLVVGH